MGNRLGEVKWFATIHTATKGTIANGSESFLSALFSLTSFPTKKEVNLKAGECNNQAEEPEKDHVRAGTRPSLGVSSFSRKQIASKRYREQNFN